MKQQYTALARVRAVTVVVLLLVGVAGQSGCRPREAGKQATAAARNPNGPGTDTAEAARRWVSTNSVRLDTVEAGYGFADLQPLKPIIGPARIVALGEATHGTREFF